MRGGRSVGRREHEHEAMMFPLLIRCLLRTAQNGIGKGSQLANLQTGSGALEQCGAVQSRSLATNLSFNYWSNLVLFGCVPSSFLLPLFSFGFGFPLRGGPPGVHCCAYRGWRASIYIVILKQGSRRP
ncbi:hypothetical protein ABW19_dt0210071 [Dactylella cylindrospora]|nr:hypothetical protein ABW19_dt0210071 [Dactylella cylindrospora]